MKVKLPHEFFIYASKFTTPSMLFGVCYFSYELHKKPGKLNPLGGYKSFSVKVNGKTINGRFQLVQTWLVDMLYELIQYNSTGKKIITKDECLYLISLYNDYQNSLDKKHFNHENIFMYLYGFYGEQKRFQNIGILMENFSREKYMLEVISKKNHPKNTKKVNFQKEFYEYTGMTPSKYSFSLFALYVFFLNYGPFIDNNKNSLSRFDTNGIDVEAILKILDSISITPEDARKNYMKRQVFYSYPILRLGKEYLCTNISLLLFLFENSNYWVMRNKYFQKKSQTFISEFGRYFEIYVEEILEKCLLKNEFSAIEETSKGKRADWHIHIGDFDFLVEQKSSISMLNIKQNHPDLKEMGKYITKTWGEAVRQLSETEKALNIDNAIKIILLYEDYYAGQCLDELFRLDETLENDGRYWLINIREFEMLLDTYKNNPMEFDKIIKEKLMDDSSLSSSGHDVESILNNHNIFINNYLISNGIGEYARKEFKNYGDLFGEDESQTEG